MKVITQWCGWGWFSVFVHGDVLWFLVYERTNGQNHAYIYMALMLAYILIYIYNSYMYEGKSAGKSIKSLTVGEYFFIWSALRGLLC